MIKIYNYSILLLIIIKISSSYLTSFSLYGDEAQYWLWSQSLDFGYFSKPPLIAWFLYLHTIIFGDSFFSLKMFPIIIYFFISFSVYKLCLQLSLTKSESALCSISFLIIPAASVSSFLISTDLLLLLFWTLTMTKLLEIRLGGSFINFVLLGVFLGLAFLAKYAALYFILSFLILILSDKKTMLVIKNNILGFFIFFFVFVLVLLPNVYWNINNEWVTFSHTSDNASLQNINPNISEPLKFLIAQIFMLGPVLCFGLFYLFKSFRFDFENKFLLIFSIPIMVIILVESFLVRANANWAAPALISLFVLLFRFVIKKNQNLIKINFIFNYMVAVFLFFSILFSSNIKIFDRIRGVDVFSNEVLAMIDSADLVVADRIIFSNISYEARKKANKIYMPYLKGEIITNHFQISSPLSSSHGEDFYLIGELGNISYLEKDIETKLIKEFYVPFNSSGLKFYEVKFK